MNCSKEISEIFLMVLILLIRKRISCALGCVCTIILFLELTDVDDKGLWKSTVEDEVKIK